MGEAERKTSMLLDRKGDYRHSQEIVWLSYLLPVPNY